MTKLIITLDIDNDGPYANARDPKYNGPQVTWKRFLELLAYNLPSNQSLSIRDGLSAPIENGLMIGTLRVEVQDPYVAPLKRKAIESAYADLETNPWADTVGGNLSPSLGGRGQREYWRKEIEEREPHNLAEFDKAYPLGTQLERAQRDFKRNPWRGSGGALTHNGQIDFHHRNIAETEPWNLAEFDRQFPKEPEPVVEPAAPAPAPEFPVGMVVKVGAARYVKGEGTAWTGVYGSDITQALNDFDHVIRADLKSGCGKIIINPSDTDKN